MADESVPAIGNEIRGSVIGMGPVVTKERFAQITGLTEDTVRGMVDRGFLPTVKIGRHRLVNLARVSKDCLEVEYEF